MLDQQSVRVFPYITELLFTALECSAAFDFRVVMSDLGPPFGAVEALEGRRLFVMALNTGRFVRNNQIEIYRQGVSKSLAFGTGAIWIVEREKPGLGLLVRHMA